MRRTGCRFGRLSVTRKSAGAFVAVRRAFERPDERAAALAVRFGRTELARLPAATFTSKPTAASVVTRLLFP